jgi:hypoxia up-regulated 1
MKSLNFVSKLGSFLTILVLAMNIYETNGYFIGIDLGSEYFKATILRPGKSFTMLENIQSKTKTPTSVGFKDDERVFGSDAIMKKPRFPKNVFTFFHEYLGKRFDDEGVKKFIEEFFVAYDMEEDQARQTVNFKINFNNEEFKLSTEEVFGMLFRYIKFLTDKFTGSDIRDCVVTVPNYFGYKERQAIVQAVQMSKFNLIGLISDNVGAAVQFAVNKQFNETEHYIFYNMGSSYTQATLVSYLSNWETKNNKTQEISRTVKVLGESWDKNLGGNRFNMRIVNHLLKTFDESPERKDKKSVSKDYKVAERMLPNAIKYKEILSANKEAIVRVLGVDSGDNLDGKITRETFESLIREDVERVYEPIEKLLNRTGIKLENITQIELLGGSIRVPMVQEVLKSELDKLVNFSNLVGTHMNGDDSMAFGTAYIAANSSSNFKGGKKIELYHGPNYDIKLRLNHLIDEENKDFKLCGDSIEDFAFDCIRHLNKNTTIYNIRQGLDLGRVVSFKHDGNILATIFEKFEDSDEETLLATYKITGLPNILTEMKNENITTLPKIHLRFKQDSNGILTLKADLKYGFDLYLSMQTGPTGGVEFLYTPNYVDPLPLEEIQKAEEELKSAGNSTESVKHILKMKKEVGKTKKQETKKELNVTVEYTSPLPLTTEQIKESKLKLDKIDEIDSNRIMTMDKRNTLEALIYEKKEWLETNASKKYSKQEELVNATISIKEINEWYDDEGYRANLTEITTRLDEIKEKFKPMEKRIANHKQLKKSLENFDAEMKKIKDEASTLIKTKTWLEDHYNKTFIKEYESVLTSITEMREKQEQKLKNEVLTRN